MLLVERLKLSLRVGEVELVVKLESVNGILVDRGNRLRLATERDLRDLADVGDGLVGLALIPDLRNGLDSDVEVDCVAAVEHLVAVSVLCGEISLGLLVVNGLLEKLDVVRIREDQNLELPVVLLVVRIGDDVDRRTKTLLRLQLVSLAGADLVRLARVHVCRHVLAKLRADWAVKLLLSRLRIGDELLVVIVDIARSRADHDVVHDLRALRGDTPVVVNLLDDVCVLAVVLALLAVEQEAEAVLLVLLVRLEEHADELVRVPVGTLLMRRKIRCLTECTHLICFLVFGLVVFLVFHYFF